MISADLQVLSDKAAISEVLHRYAMAIDLRDWSLLRECFTDQMQADFRSFGVRDVYQGPADDWVEAIRSTIAGLDVTQHLTANHSCRVDGDEARLTAYLQALHRLQVERGDSDYTCGGYYTCELQRSGPDWRISAYSLTVTWDRGNRDILRQAQRKSAGR